MLGEKFDEALKLASKLHRDQYRKGTEDRVPYLSHLMAVAGIVLEANAYHQVEKIEDIAIAALLHDVIEDQGAKINLEQIRERFGDTVHDIVLDCSDAIIEREGQEKEDWRPRKEAYIAKIKQKPPATILVSCADKLHNARSIMFDHAHAGDDVWERFTPTKEDTLWYYEELSKAFREAWPKNPLQPDFEAVVGRMRTAVMPDP